MKIFRTKFEIFGEGSYVIESDSDIRSYNSLLELVNDDQVLKDYVLETLDIEDENELTEEQLNNIEDDIFNYINSDEDILQKIRYAESIEDFKTQLGLRTINDIQKIWVEKDVIYAFRNYQYSDNILLAILEGFKSIDEVKEYCIENDINLSEFQCAVDEFINTYFLSSNDNFDLEDLNAIYNTGNVKTYTKDPS